MIETMGIPALVAAADAAAKTADVRVSAFDKADAGLITVYIWGDVAAVKSAVDAGCEAASRVGKLVGAHVIPRPDAEVASMLRQLEKQPKSPSPDTGIGQNAAASNQQPEELADGTASDLSSMSVQELRRLARGTAGFPLSGRQISAAGKAELLRLFAENAE